jgi:hypothetical protein
VVDPALVTTPVRHLVDGDEVTKVLEGRLAHLRTQWNDTKDKLLKNRRLRGLNFNALASTRSRDLARGSTASNASGFDRCFATNYQNGKLCSLQLRQCQIRSELLQDLFIVSDATAQITNACYEGNLGK